MIDRVQLRRLPGALVLLVLVATLLLWQRAERPADYGAADLHDKRIEPLPIARFGAATAPAQPLRRDGQEPVPLPVNAHIGDDAVADQFLLSFANRAALERFVRAAVAAGRVIGRRLDALNTLQLHGTLADWADLPMEDARWSGNYVIRVPELPDQRQWSAAGLLPFAGEVLGFLGVPPELDNGEWGKGVTIAVLDTGWIPHSALSRQAVQMLDLTDAAANGEYSAHGTAVAGLIGSRSAVAPGIAPAAELLAVRVLNGSGTGDVFTLAAGIVAAVDGGASIINMSLGSTVDSPLLRSAVAYADAAGVLMIASTGNAGSGMPTYPAAYPEVLGVAAIDAAGARAPFSNFGPGVDLAAPGYQVHALWDSDRYVLFDGTSAAAPLVAGMAAQLLASGLARTPSDARGLLLANANEAGYPGHDPEYGAGILNAQRLLQLGQRGVYDIALADFYPAPAEALGQTFPLYISFENRGTEFVGSSRVQLDINGTAYHYSLPGLHPGAVEFLQVAVPKHALTSSQPFRVSARVDAPATVTDSRPHNNQGGISISMGKPDD